MKMSIRCSWIFKMRIRKYWSSNTYLCFMKKSLKHRLNMKKLLGYNKEGRLES
jgi:hypothetical protein